MYGIATVYSAQQCSSWPASDTDTLPGDHHIQFLQQRKTRLDILLALSHHDDDMQQANLRADFTRHPIMEHAM